jgi:phosphoribosylamine--glycine ligase
MKILIIGNGGREHALAWKAAQSPEVSKVYVAPGNAGTALEDKVENVNIEPIAFPQLVDFVQSQQIALTIVGPEAPLCHGIVDYFAQHQLPIFGPSQQAAQLESSKAFSKALMTQWQIPTAHYASFTELNAAIEYASQQSYPLVIKADGLAAGKGVVITESVTEATTVLRQMMQQQQFGQASQRVIIEEFLSGEEASFIVLTDGETILPLASAQDHKALYAGDCGPNTGGMGAYSPAPVLSKALQQQVTEQVIRPMLNGLRQMGIRYTGFLYAGLMLTAQGPKVLEFNCRLGDPEAQVILMRMQSDLIKLCQATLNGKLATCDIQWDPRPALGVVLSAAGYPDDYQIGKEITGLPMQTTAQQKIFHAGTCLESDKIISNGGRLLCATAIADKLSLAQQQAYQLLSSINRQYFYYREDIGYRALKESTQI